jgi:hypothetical protein
MIVGSQVDDYDLPAHAGHVSTCLVFQLDPSHQRLICQCDRVSNKKTKVSKAPHARSRWKGRFVRPKNYWEAEQSGRRMIEDDDRAGVVKKEAD